MLAKRPLHDGGLDVETSLLGPAVFLDIWAVRHLIGAAAGDLRARFCAALEGARGSLLVSTAWITELETLPGDARARAQALFSSIGAHWLLLNPIVSAVAAREARDELGAYLSIQSLSAFVLERSGELLRGDCDPHSLSDAEFFDLGRTLVWTADDTAAAATSAAQAMALKDAARERADRDRDERRRDREAHNRLYPRLGFDSGRMASVHNAVWREVTRRSLGRAWMPNDGFDTAHVIPAMAIGGLVAVITPGMRSDRPRVGTCLVVMSTFTVLVNWNSWSRSWKGGDECRAAVGSGSDAARRFGMDMLLPTVGNSRDSGNGPLLTRLPGRSSHRSSDSLSKGAGAPTPEASPGQPYPAAPLERRPILMF